MQPLKKLLVICEPNYIEATKNTRNLSTNEILGEYSRYFDEVHCLCPGQENAYDLPSSIGVRFHTLNGYRGGKINKTLFLLKSNKEFLKNLIEKYQIDIIQFRIPSFMSMSLYKDAKDIKIPKTIYIAGDVRENFVSSFGKILFIKQIAKYLEHKQFDLVRNTIAVATGDVLKEKYKNVNPNIHAYYSSTHKDVNRANCGPIPDTFNIVYIGRIDPGKRVEDLITAISLVKGKIKNINVNIIGDGNGGALDNIKQIVKNLDLEQYFHFHGYISKRSDIDKILLNSNALVLPSVTEGTAKVLPEAMSRGVIPIAVSGAGSNNFIIKNGVNGFLVAPYAPEEIAESILKLHNQPNLILKMRDAAYEYAESKTMKNEIQKLWEFVFQNVKQHKK